MRFRITGGVGTTSRILGYLAKAGYRVMLADEIAHELMSPGTECYDRICETFGAEDIFLPQGGLDRGKLAAVIFSDEAKRRQMNAIVHPAVRVYVEKEAAREKQGGKRKLLVLEAALLIEEHYDEICDELWYIYTREDIRRKRLMASRGYSTEKVDRIFASQLTEEVYREHCRVVIDNNGSVEEAFAQIDRALSEKK
ncbi:MAG: dephospho-CoA kinase [Roseburia hominis]